jgi:hypothetical protein
MSTYVFTIAVTSDDDEMAQLVAVAYADQAEELAALPAMDGAAVHTFIADPVKVTP